MEHTALYNTHLSLSGQMVEFAGYAMPVQYPEGIVQEHLHVRSQAGIFDVSHMGQLLVSGPDAASFLSYVTPSRFTDSPRGKAVYTLLLTPEGGIVDDLIITRLDEEAFFLVVNASRKNEDTQWIKNHAGSRNLRITPLPERALIAVQGPESEDVVCQLFPAMALEDQRYMTALLAGYDGNEACVADNVSLLESGEGMLLSRLGYTGEDGFEISVHAKWAASLWLRLLGFSQVKPIGLGARDSLRLEMGYPLYGHDISMETDPVSASLRWVITKGHDGFIGAEKILPLLSAPPALRRVGILLKDRGMLREGYEIFAEEGGEPIGRLTSGGYSPTLKTAIGMAYIPSSYAVSAPITVNVRNKPLAAVVHGLSFVPARTKR